jgi:hypothetical protein
LLLFVDVLFDFRNMVLKILLNLLDFLPLTFLDPLMVGFKSLALFLVLFTQHFVFFYQVFCESHFVFEEFMALVLLNILLVPVNAALENLAEVGD